METKGKGKIVIEIEHIRDGKVIGREKKEVKNECITDRRGVKSSS